MKDKKLINIDLKTRQALLFDPETPADVIKEITEDLISNVLSNPVSILKEMDWINLILYHPNISSEVKTKLEDLIRMFIV